MQPRVVRLAGTAVLAGAILAAACSSTTTTADGDDPGRGTGAATTTPGGTDPTGSTPPSYAIPERFVGHRSEVYAQGENWLCVPGAPNDLCATEDLSTTVVRADGTTEVLDVRPATDPSFDCFYVYPTVNLVGDAPADEAMAADIGAETAVIRAQAARFSQVCDVYAPLYRQLTLGGFGAPNRAELSDRAYADVRDAFAHYLANWNEGRPVLLIGHSQGAGMLARLLVEEFDDDPELRSLLVSAMLLGGRAQVPDGADVGADFQNLPVCRSATQTGCVIGFNAVGADTPPEDRARWGSAGAGNRKVCTNPADLVAGGDGSGAAPLRSIFANVGTFGAGIEITTPWVELEGALEATCERGEGVTVLLITSATATDDRRDLGDRLDNVPGWGLHITEVGLTQVDLIELARRQGAAMT